MFFDPSINWADRLSEVKQRLEEKEPVHATVRELLGWSGFQRRGADVVAKINLGLDKYGLTTDPDYQTEFIDSKIEFKLKEITPELEAKRTDDGAINSEPIRESEPLKDTSFRVRMLAPANISPVSVKADDTIEKALTIMRLKDFSQLPVMQGERKVNGILTWRGLALRLCKKGPLKYVREVMDQAAEVDGDKTIYSVLPIIAEHGYVLVRNKNNVVSGIVTSSDLVDQYHNLSEPFLLLGEIEQFIRHLIDSKLTESDWNPVFGKANRGLVTSATDLTFGHYVAIFQSSDLWQRLGLKEDRDVFTKELDEVRIIRNDVMHFDPDPLAADALPRLRNMARFLRDLLE